MYYNHLSMRKVHLFKGYVAYENRPKIRILMFGPAQTSHFRLCDIITPPLSISYMLNTKSGHFSPKIKQYIHGNRKSQAIS